MKAQKTSSKVVQKQEEIKETQLVVEPSQNELTETNKSSKKQSLSSLYKKKEKEAKKKSGGNMTDAEIEVLQQLFKEEFPGFNFTVSHTLFGKLTEKHPKQTLLVEDSRFSHGFVQVKKKFPNFKQVLLQLNQQYLPEQLQENCKLVNVQLNSVNDKVDVLTIQWSK